MYFSLSLVYALKIFKVRHGVTEISEIQLLQILWTHIKDHECEKSSQRRNDEGALRARGQCQSASCVFQEVFLLIPSPGHLHAYYLGRELELGLFVTTLKMSLKFSILMKD